jgi:nicotinamide phosphoribosyltransferase
MNRAFRIPIAVITDSYKAGHYLMYPEADSMSAYGEFRVPYNKDSADSRFVAYGIRYIVEHYIAIQWTLEDVEQADKFFSTHNAGMFL